MSPNKRTTTMIIAAIVVIILAFVTVGGALLLSGGSEASSDTSTNQQASQPVDKDATIKDVAAIIEATSCERDTDLPDEYAFECSLPPEQRGLQAPEVGSDVWIIAYSSQEEMDKAPSYADSSFKGELFRVLWADNTAKNWVNEKLSPSTTSQEEADAASRADTDEGYYDPSSDSSSVTLEDLQARFDYCDEGFAIFGGSYPEGMTTGGLCHYDDGKEVELYLTNPSGADTVDNIQAVLQERLTAADPTGQMPMTIFAGDGYAISFLGSPNHYAGTQAHDRIADLGITNERVITP